jgi:hypothetical protein
MLCTQPPCSTLVHNLWGVAAGEGGYEEAMALPPSEARALRAKSAVCLVRSLDLLALLATNGLAERVVKVWVCVCVCVLVGSSRAPPLCCHVSPPHVGGGGGWWCGGVCVCVCVCVFVCVCQEGLWDGTMHRLLGHCIVRPWATGVLNRPEEVSLSAFLVSYLNLDLASYYFHSAYGAPLGI